jgi:sec-independent protein translocase protein TatA
MGIIQFIGGQELLIVLLVVLLLFGAKQIPDFARMAGKGMREFKKATEDIKREINEETKGVSDDINDLKNNLKS